jgi:recombination protein RecA
MARPKKDLVCDDAPTKSDRDEMVASLVAALNKTHKDGSKSAYFLDDKEDPSTVMDWVPTGSTLLDLAIGNAPSRGLPAGRIIEVSGLEGTGKSLVAAHVLANTQKKGGIGVMIDTEAAAAPDFWQAVGVDLKNLVYVTSYTVEDIFNKLEFMIGHIRKNHPDRLVTFVIDSVAGASTEKEMEALHGIQGFNTGKSILLSTAMRKLTGLIAEQKILVVFTNQVRMNISATMPGQEKYITSGGKSIAFHSSVRVRLRMSKKLKNTDGDIIGIECKATVDKNRLGPPHRVAIFKIMFDSGISDIESWWRFCKDKKLFDKEMTTPTFLKKIQEEPGFKDEIYQKICEKYIMQYKSPNSSIDESLEEVDPDTDVLDENSNQEE